MGVLTPHVRMDKGSSDLGDVTVISSIFFIVVFRNMMGDVRVFPGSINVARSHKDKGHRRLASSNYIDTENIIYMKSESMKIYLILLTFMRTPAPCS